MMNRVVLVGRLTKDPELRYTPAGAAVATFTLAVNRTFTNQQGDREADFVNCVVWRKAAENVANFLKKGSLAGVDGRLQTRNYEANDGRRVYVTEVVAESVQFLEPRNANAGNSGASGSNQGSNNYNDDSSSYNGGNQQPQSNQGNAYNQNSQQSSKPAFSNPFASDGKPIDISDDDLPF
ncbi:single-stranded DNA-binding protein [Brochothrix thermosphacta]|uniref:single-stranded DNA-binding protein n=1 Tax=Brochothrix thermosphacta TaxID=2756 RepID=UPI0039AFEFD9